MNKKERETGSLALGESRSMASQVDEFTCLMHCRLAVAGSSVLL